MKDISERAFPKGHFDEGHFEGRAFPKGERAKGMKGIVHKLEFPQKLLNNLRVGTPEKQTQRSSAQKHWQKLSTKVLNVKLRITLIIYQHPNHLPSPHLCEVEAIDVLVKRSPVPFFEVAQPFFKY